METLPEHSKWEIHHNKKQKMVNSLSRDNKDIIRFFSGEFDYIYDKCKKDNSTLGWSSGFKGIAVPLFMLLLNKDNKIPKAEEKLINGIMHRLGSEGDDKGSFLDILLIWKEKVNLTKEQYEKYISWLKEEVDNRTEAVVGGGYRNSYYKAAVLIATLGETLESNGMINGKIDLIEHYKKIHYRKIAFKAEFELLSE